MVVLLKSLLSNHPTTSTFGLIVQLLSHHFYYLLWLKESFNILKKRSGVTVYCFHEVNSFTSPGPLYLLLTFTPSFCIRSNLIPEWPPNLLSPGSSYPNHHTFYNPLTVPHSSNPPNPYLQWHELKFFTSPVLQPTEQVYLWKIPPLVWILFLLQTRWIVLTETLTFPPLTSPLTISCLIPRYFSQTYIRDSESTGPR